MQIHLPYKILLTLTILSLIIGYISSGYSLIRELLITIISVLIILIAVILGFWVKRTIQSHKTTLNPYGEPRVLIITGPFKLSRNPMYLSYVMIAIGVAIYSQSIFSFVGFGLFLLFLNYKIIPNEERKLYTIFPSQYKKYVENTRKWF